MSVAAPAQANVVITIQESNKTAVIFFIKFSSVININPAVTILSYVYKKVKMNLNLLLYLFITECPKF